MPNMTKEQAERIADAWIRDPENALLSCKSDPGEVLAVRNFLVSFILGNNKKPRNENIDIITVQEVLDNARSCMDKNDGNNSDKRRRAYEAFIESVESLKQYLMTCEGGTDSEILAQPLMSEEGGTDRYSAGGGQHPAAT